MINPECPIIAWAELQLLPGTSIEEAAKELLQMYDLMMQTLGKRNKFTGIFVEFNGAIVKYKFTKELDRTLMYDKVLEDLKTAVYRR